jgi:trimethylguanosine synthase
MDEFLSIDSVGKRYRFKTKLPIIGDKQGLLLTNYQYTGERNVEKITKILGKVKVAEICSGIGGGTLFLAKGLPFVYAVDIDPKRISAAKINAATFNVLNKIEFIQGDALNPTILDYLREEGVQTVITDVGWRENLNLPMKQTTSHLSNTIPPTPELLEKIKRRITNNIIMRLPLTVNLDSIQELGNCEIEKMYYDNKPRFYNVYFGELAENNIVRQYIMR